MQLVRDRWYAVLSSGEVQDAPVATERLGLELVLWRDTDGSVRAADDRCPHRRAKLSAGKVKDGLIQCPFHGFRFDGDGACRAIPAHPERRIPKAMRVGTIEARDEHGFIWLWTGEGAAPDEPVPFFDFDDWVHTGSELREPVDTHYTVGVENQLDFAHLAFVHESTIGRFATEETEVDVTQDGDLIVSRGEGSTTLELLGPNVWRMNLGSTTQMLAFAPVDEGRMVYYVRAYRRSSGLRALDWVIGRVGRFFNRFVLREDKRVAETIPKGETRLAGLGEILVPSDAPIVAYRRWRESRRAPFAPFGERVVPEDALVRDRPSLVRAG